MNGICHLEIPSKDFEKARKFYGDLFNWQFNYIKEMDYLIFKAPEGISGGFAKEYDIAGRPGITVYIEVDDINAIIQKAKNLGGNIIKEKTMITPDIGYFAFVKDLEGNQIGLWAKK